ncbi:MAG: hypothetical protein AAB588_00885 [Patescibacteria group bacterium]
MSKRFSVTVTITVLILLIAGGGFYYVQQKKWSTPKHTDDAVVTQGTTTSNGYNCETLGLPPGSYTQECSPTEAHELQVNKLAEDEYKAGDEHQLTHITNVYEKSGEIYIDADYVQWISDPDDCVWDDGIHEVPKTKPKCNNNGYEIINENPKIRTFKLSPNVKIRLFEEFGNIPDLNTLSPQEFMGSNKYGQKFYVHEDEGAPPPYHLPFQLILKNGKVLFIHQVYVP